MGVSLRRCLKAAFPFRVRRSTNLPLHMRQLLRDIVAHPVSAGSFLLCWLLIFAYTFPSGTPGIPDVVVLLHLAMPVLSGALVGWWRFPLREGLLANRWRPAGPPLSGILVAVVAVSVVFVREGVESVASGTWRLAHIGGFLVSWLGATAVFAAIGSVFGLFGALLSRPLAGLVKPSGPRKDEAA